MLEATKICLASCCFLVCINDAQKLYPQPWYAPAALDTNLAVNMCHCHMKFVLVVIAMRPDIVGYKSRDFDVGASNTLEKLSFQKYNII